MMNSDPPLTVDLNLQTRSRQYPTPSAQSTPESPSSGSTEPLLTSNGPLHIPQPKVEVHTKMPKGPLRRNATSGRAAHSYSIVDDLAQSPAAISTLELLQSCPSQKKALLSTMGTVDPADDQMIVFDAHQSEHPPLPASVAFQIPVKIRNANVSRCIIDEGASTCVMSASVWKQLGSPELAPSTITLRAWDDHASQPIGLFHNCPTPLPVRLFALTLKSSTPR